MGKTLVFVQFLETKKMGYKENSQLKLQQQHHGLSATYEH